ETLSELIMKLLAPRPEHRCQSAQEVADALDAISKGTAQTRRRFLRTRTGIAAATVVAVLAVIGSMVGHHFGPDTDDGSTPSEAALPLFAPAVAYPAGLYPQDVAVADFNGDGKLDLVAANLQSHSISVLLGKG